MNIRTIIVVMAVLAFAPTVYGQDEEAPLGKSLGVVTQGWGTAAVTDLFAAHLDGNMGLFSAGIGFGLSYKWVSPAKHYPLELGLFVAPQLAVTKDNKAQGSIAALLHINLLKGFGAGLGYDFFKGGVGAVAPDKSTLFFTLGFGLTNSRD